MSLATIQEKVSQKTTKNVPLGDLKELSNHKEVDAAIVTYYRNLYSNDNIIVKYLYGSICRVNIYRRQAVKDNFCDKIYIHESYFVKIEGSLNKKALDIESMLIIDYTER